MCGYSFLLLFTFPSACFSFFSWKLILTKGVTFAAFWSTGTVFAHKISPEGMKATMLLFMNAMYGGLGQSIGAYWGGKLQSNIGTVNTFLYSAAADAVFICFVSVYLNSRKTSNFRDPQPLSAKSVQ